MTWTELADLLQKQLEVLFQDETPALQVLAPDALHATVVFPIADRKFQKGLYKAVVEFARKGRWPKLLPEEKLLLYFRLRYGLSVVQTLASIQPTGETAFPSNQSASPRSKEPLLVWLLETVWEDSGLGYTLELCTSVFAEPPPVPDLPSN